MKIKSWMGLIFFAGIVTALFGQTINIVVVSTTGSTTVPGGMQSTVDQLSASAPGATINITVVTSFTAASDFRSNHAGQTNYLVGHGLYDEDGNFTGELGDTPSQNWPDLYSPKTVADVNSYGYNKAYYCFMSDWPGAGYKISNDDIGADIGQRHNISYDYAGKSWVMFCREALASYPGPSTPYCSRYGYWGSSEEYADYTYEQILQGAHPDSNIINY